MVRKEVLLLEKNQRSANAPSILKVLYYFYFLFVPSYKYTNSKKPTRFLSLFLHPIELGSTSDMDKKNTPCWSSCPDCQGQGKKSQRLRKKVRLQYQQLVASLSAAGEVALPEAPKAPLVSCSLCGGS